MNPKVQELLDKKIGEIQKKNLKLRNEHLINLGLIDESKIERKYLDSYKSDSTYDPEKKKYFFEKHFALDVSDEEYEEICKYYPIKDKESYNKYSELKLRKDVRLIKYWVIFGSIATIISFIAFISVIILLFFDLI
ncbi:MAG: hypothetical protein H6Q16_1444 [Bacteroidetes bacterium]|nr:hypothetical protein [Bacteroidota bacterium]